MKRIVIALLISAATLGGAAYSLMGQTDPCAAQSKIAQTVCAKDGSSSASCQKALEKVKICIATH